MLRTRGLIRMLSCAPAVLVAVSILLVAAASRADEAPSEVMPAPVDSGVDSPSENVWSRPNDDDPDSLPKDVIRMDQPFGDPLPVDSDFTWQWAPTGLIYHSYMAGEHEPRMSMFMFNDLSGRNLWDATLGGRAGLLRYGNCDPVKPVGYQLDVYGAAIARLDADHKEDLEACDYVFGFPITWGDAQWQWKFGYAHTSSHMGDEFAIRHPGALNNRINYVRDSLVLGTSYYVIPAWRLYGESGWAFNASGGAEPWEFEFGTELSQPYPASCWTPFVAVNGRVRQEHNFSGDLTVQFGYLRRGILDQTLRLGAQYYDGKSNEFQFYYKNEQQLGLGIWYDF